MAFKRLDLANMVENISNVKDQRTLVNQSLQIALDRVFEFFDFPYYIQDNGVIKTVNDYTTGTARVTNGSTTVTGVNTVWTSAMEGRKFRHANENPWYRIKTFVSATELTLEQPYQGTTDATGSSYTIYKDEYRLNADVDKYKLMRQAQNNQPLFSLHPTRFDETHPMPQSLSDPTIEIMEGTLLDTYTTGTVTGTVNTSTLTGSSTSWTSVEGLGRMSRLRIGNYVYTVKSVDSDTQITLYETLSVGVTAGSTYEICLSNLRVQLYQIPDAQRVIYYRYFRIPAPLTNDYDCPDMPNQFHWVLMYGALSIILMQKGDINKAQQEAEARFIDGLNMMKLKLGSFTPDRIYSRKSVDRLRSIRGFNDGIEKSSFDRRYSS